VTEQERGTDRYGVIDHGGRADGPTLLLLHGLMGRGRAWGPHLDWLRAHGRVLTVDAAWHRGRDFTDGQDLPGPGDPRIRTERFVADAAAALEAHTDSPAVVIGHSMGGLHAWCLAAARPDLVSAIVVEDMGPDFSGMTTRPWDAWFDSWPVEFDRRAAEEMFGPVAARYFLDSFDRTPAGWRLHGRMPVWREIAQHWGTRDYWAQWRATDCPALLLEAEHSLVPPGQMRAMAEIDRGAPTRYRRIDRAGHLIQADDPARYRAEVEDFLAAVAVLPG